VRWQCHPLCPAAEHSVVARKPNGQVTQRRLSSVQPAAQDVVVRSVELHSIADTLGEATQQPPRLHPARGVLSKGYVALLFQIQVYA